MKYKNIFFYGLLDLGFIGYLLLIFMLVRAIFSWYGEMLQSLQAELQLLGLGLQEGSVESLDLLETALGSFNSQIQWVFILLFIIMPMLIYLGFWLAFSLKLTHSVQGKWWDWKIALMSLGWGLPFFLIFVILLNSFVAYLREALLAQPKYFILVLLFLLLILIHFGYITTMIALQQKGNILKKIIKFQIKSLKSFHYYLPLFLTNIIIILFLFWLFVRLATGSLGWFNLLHLFIVLVALLLLNLEKEKFADKLLE